MKRIFFIEDELPNKITYYHLLAFVISLPFDLFYSEVILISLGIHTAINFRKDDFKRLKNRNLFILTSLYFLSLVCSLYTTNKDEALFDLTKELGLFIFPLIFCLTRLNISKYKDRLLLAFAMTCVCAILYLFIDSIRVIFYYQLPISFLFSDSFLNQRFSEPLEIHATYLLLYCFTNSAAMQKKVLTGLGCFILLIGLLQLASRAVFMAESIIVIIIFPFFISQKRIRIRFLSTSMLILLVALILLLKNESFKERYVEDLKDDFVSNFSSEGRVIRWK